jgi:multidrug efflux pump subunit AcrA (membrane-fusion protein)
MALIMRIYPAIIIFFIVSCKQASPADEEAIVEVQTPVTVVHILRDTMRDYIELNAMSSFLLKSFIKATANGYLVSGTVRLGQPVSSGQQLFSIKTKEAESIGNAVNALDSSFKFSGTSIIRSGGKGYITQLNHVQGDYVQDGEQLAVISDAASFVFLMEMPFELRQYLTGKKNVEVLLPDGTIIPGYISSSMPAVDPAAQTQAMIIKVNTSMSLPEGLVAKVRIVKTAKNNTVTLPPAAVLTGETQSEFWIMKTINDSTAVKVPVVKGMQTKERIEILSPPLNDSDRILVTGNYGLEDTAKIKILNQAP